LVPGHHLEHLEELEPADVYEKESAFPVQTVIRPKTEEYHDFRGYAGKLYGNNIKVGDAVTVLPSLTESVVTNIHFLTSNLRKQLWVLRSIELGNDQCDQRRHDCKII
jgi:sulfate adenylyltransferase subunit 1